MERERDQAANLEEPAALQRDAQLHEVQPVSRADVPAAPDVWRLAKRPIAAAWHVSQDTVKPERDILRFKQYNRGQGQGRGGKGIRGVERPSTDLIKR